MLDYLSAPSNFCLNRSSCLSALFVQMDGGVSRYLHTWIMSLWFFLLSTLHPNLLCQYMLRDHLAWLCRMHVCVSVGMKLYHWGFLALTVHSSCLSFSFLLLLGLKIFPRWRQTWPMCTACLSHARVTRTNHSAKSQRSQESLFYEPTCW